MHELLGDVEKEGDFDVLLNKWVDVLNRDLRWELKGSSFKKEDVFKEDIVKADFRDGEQTFHFESWRIVYEYEGQWKKCRDTSDNLGGISISYVPDSSGKKLSLQLSFRSSGNGSPSYYTSYEVIVGFNSKSGKKRGHAEVHMMDPGYDHRPKPCNSDYERIVGANFYSMLINLCKQMREAAMEDIKKKEQAKQNNIKDEFDSI